MAMAGLTEKGRLLVCGDNLQLPPIFSTDLGVEDNIAEQSIYDFLAKQNFPEQPLNETFRLNAPLVEFPSQEYYGGNYKSAPPIKDRRMKLTKAWRMDMDKWKQAIIDPELPLVVLLHDGPEGGKENPIEAQLVADLATEFHNITTVKEEKFWTEDVAIMSPHNKHNDLLREKLNTIHILRLWRRSIAFKVANAIASFIPYACQTQSLHSLRRTFCCLPTV